jgi:hypothetical protein
MMTKNNMRTVGSSPAASCSSPTMSWPEWTAQKAGSRDAVQAGLSRMNQLLDEMGREL